MLKRSSQGFTVVETILVLSISSLLLSMAIAGQSQLRVRAQFTDSIEKAKITLARAKNEALSTHLKGSGNDLGRIFFAKRVIFTPGSNVIDIDTLVISPTNVISVAPSSAEQIPLPWGVHYVTSASAGASTGKEILFIRWPKTGTLYTFTPGLSSPFNDLAFSSYDPLPANPDRASQDFQLIDSLGHEATISVEGKTDSVSRVFH